VGVAAIAVAIAPKVWQQEIMAPDGINKRESGSGNTSGYSLIELLVAMLVLAILVVLLSQVINQTSRTIGRSSDHMQSDIEAQLIFTRMADDIAQIINRTDVDSLFIGMPTNASGTDHNDQMFFYSQGSGFVTNGSNHSTTTLISYLVTNQSLMRLGVACAWDDQMFVTTSNALTWFNGTSPLSNFGNATNYYHPLGPSVFRMEIALLMEPGSINVDGTTNGTNAYANITNGTNPWYGLHNVASIVVGLGILDQTSRKIVTPQQLTNLAAALPDATTNGGIPIASWTSIAFSVAGIPQEALSQVRFYQRSFPVTR
jgi:prepilin-type N-terminal cleavage/methylation domain-containing protein